MCTERGGAQVEPLAGIPPGISHLLSASWSLVNLVFTHLDFARLFLGVCVCVFSTSIVDSGSFLPQIVHILCHFLSSLCGMSLAVPLPPPAPE